MNMLKRPHFIRLKWWPWLLIALFFIFSISALPYLIPDDNGIQIRASSQGITLPDGFYLYQSLNDHDIHIKSITPEENSLVIRFDSTEQSEAAQQLLHQLLPEGFEILPLEMSVSEKKKTSRMSHH
ncbi:hypothetical protein BL250_12575 [Erwinia sp. OLTSP20]|uniref:EnvZ/OmpR regulon moderator MzrA n=1 Tax=unclassified Erwinia TaxID=2622719 RepID=UPI000C463CA6|nr:MULTISPECIES: EnvZ/OmpR regulon moderator MzrA [unclassified Erwinia]PIJ50225.1 hypothetical protein BV501_09085 [Erwinia sp. OAMSP11]PIJ72062.1 hypothetical protein BK416_09985 [Erwinia sp. OLSSP12]PIJ81353.1 hypothetical protein BLD47_08810 [Erwinia sp. OLCASP19]PIJ84059.1 hypothetical protein BLD46_08390 [Erwinia sp. OLMTSP26]PIJ85758.1 hypothetical protein BLD49_09610 [Erwinia sp. OLMDSP33]